MLVVVSAFDVRHGGECSIRNVGVELCKLEYVGARAIGSESTHKACEGGGRCVQFVAVDLPGNSGGLQTIEYCRTLDGRFASRHGIRISSRGCSNELVAIGIGPGRSRSKPEIRNTELSGEPVVIREILCRVEAHGTNALFVGNCGIRAGRSRRRTGGADHKAVHPRSIGGWVFCVKRPAGDDPICARVLNAHRLEMKGVDWSRGESRGIRSV